MKPEIKPNFTAFNHHNRPRFNSVSLFLMTGIGQTNIFFYIIKVEDVAKWYCLITKWMKKIFNTFGIICDTTIRRQLLARGEFQSIKYACTQWKKINKTINILISLPALGSSWGTSSSDPTEITISILWSSVPYNTTSTIGLLVFSLGVIIKRTFSH